MSGNVYERLAQKLDALPNGYPRTKSGIEVRVLRKIFTEDEAEIACTLKLIPEAPEQIAERLTRDPKALGEILEKMVAQGEIGGAGPLGARRYHVLPFVVGVYEFQLSRMDKELAELMEEYIAEGFLTGVGNSSPAFLHTIPIEQAVDAQLEVHPFESVRQLMDKAKVFCTHDCICRKEQALIGKACDKPQGNCISMSMDEHAFDINYGGKIVNRKEAERIMKEAEDAGLVHATMTITDETYHFCNCCACCCGLLRGVSKFNAPGMLAKSNYWASIDPDTCAACGTCANDRCPMGAISEKDGSYEVDQKRCIGCGVCSPTCPTESISLVRKPADQCIQPPPNMVSWMMERSMNTGKPLDKFM
ncbi:4Fe-4S binding protein [Candidatus Poribacteria bacterium]|nr:4Fe-4S binding protein [Candidatus Poribacteria bacterium]